jgi:small-conductance mechanosensitive channel
MDWLINLGRELSRILNVRLFALHGVDITVGGVGACLLSVLVAILLGRVANRTLVRLLRQGGRISEEGTLYALGRILQYAVTLIGVLIGLENVGFSITTLAAVGAVFAVGIGFGLQNVAQNFISGLILLFERPIKKGDVIAVQGILGVVDEIAIRATRIVTFDEVALIVPNSKLISDIVENRSEPTLRFRTKIDVNLTYGSDTQLVERTLLDVAKAHPKVLLTPEPLVLFANFGDSAMQFQLLIWVADPSLGSGVASDLRHAILPAFAAAGLSIPMPQREIRVRPEVATPVG